MTQTHQTLINGVDTEKLAQVIGSMEQDTSLAACRFRARNTWITGAHNRTSIQGFYAAEAEDASRTTPFVHDADEPPVLLGENRGANPVEYALTALAGCLTTTLVYYGSVMGIELEEVTSELEGELDLRGLFDLDQTVRNGYRNIRVDFHIKSPEPRERLLELVDIAQRFSVVYDTITRPVHVSVKLAD